MESALGTEINILSVVMEFFRLATKSGLVPGLCKESLVVLCGRDRLVVDGTYWRCDSLRQTGWDKRQGARGEELRGCFSRRRRSSSAALWTVVTS